jgi:RHS repeat-associated protein
MNGEFNQSVLIFLSKQKTSATPEIKANGERIIKKSELGETQYISANYIVRNKTVISKHVFAGNQRIASTVSMKNNCGTMTEQNTMYFHPDHLGSSSYVTDKKGNFFEMIEYLPYGETLYDEAATVDKTEFRFTGHLKDDETGFYYCHARYYDPKMGKFLSVDPILEQYLQGKPNGGVYSSENMNLYMYVGNNPVKYIDPNGTDKKTIEKIVKEIDVTLNMLWSKSFQPAGDAVEEWGGIVIQSYDKKSYSVGYSRTDHNSGSVSIPPENNSYSVGSIISTIHTHPYSSAEGGFTGATFSSGDILYMSGKNIDISIVEAGSQRFALEVIDRKKFEAFVSTGKIPSIFDNALKAANRSGKTFQESCIDALKAVVKSPNSGLKAYQTEKEPYPNGLADKTKFKEIK